MKLGLINLVLCFVVALIISPMIIKFLHKLKFGQSILIYVEKHKQKSGTATMGGIIFLLSSFVGYFVFFQKNRRQRDFFFFAIKAFAPLLQVFFGRSQNQNMEMRNKGVESFIILHFSSNISARISQFL